MDPMSIYHDFQHLEKRTIDQNGHTLRSKAIYVPIYSTPNLHQ